MLVKTPLKANDTVSLKLLSGEEIIATYQEEKSGKILVQKPVQITPVGEGQMQFMPFMITTSEEEFEFNADLVVTLARTAEGLAKEYTKATSNIQIVN